ncbi:MAG TPA: ABC transporter permease [Acidimicrobiales bacterium]|jgi:simple sugar transport system permease protein|nr:ABC transporter permease [Acidimicrobiales bacterium]
MSLALEVSTGAVRGGTSILYAALGETVAERSGVINLGTEGSVVAGCLAAYAATSVAGNPWVGVLAGAAAGGALAFVHGLMVVKFKTNQLATGLVVMFLGLGLTSLFGVAYVSKVIDNFKPWKVPLLSGIPWIGEVFFQHDPLVYVSYVLAPLVWWALTRTRVGLLVRAAGERPEALATYGYDPGLIRIGAVVVGGMLAGIGGAQLSTAYANAWFENMANGRGFIAVALVIFAAWHPIKAVGGAYLFGAALALAPALQARGYQINQFALDAMPYVLTLIALVAFGRRRVDEAPEGLKEVFELAPSG